MPAAARNHLAVRDEERDDFAGMIPSYPDNHARSNVMQPVDCQGVVRYNAGMTSALSNHPQAMYGETTRALDCGCHVSPTPPYYPYRGGGGVDAEVGFDPAEIGTMFTPDITGSSLLDETRNHRLHVAALK